MIDPIYEIIKFKRKEHGFSAVRFARHLGIETHSAYHKHEMGHHFPHMNIVRATLSNLGLSLLVMENATGVIWDVTDSKGICRINTSTDASVVSFRL